ncbi:helix-turn-helix domain-containing protein [Providencia burhodogranariea]|uniref:helix-turn-helix domain-containing protein n=1 Tax=Providencia burhodogranariea TaxID=516074 RepID=UPI000A0798F7
MHAIAEEIYYLRKINGFSGKYLAQINGVLQHQIPRYESGKTNINIGTLISIINTLNCTLDSFLSVSIII